LSGTILGHLIKFGEIISLILDLILLEMQEKFLGGLAAIILVEGVEVLDAIIDKLVDLEQEMGLVSKQFPGDIFILIRVQNSLNKIKMIKNQLQIIAIYMGLT
jgi:hypothetical protein